MRMVHYPEAKARPAGWAIALDLTVLLVLVAATLAIRATAPANTYSYAQLHQIRASIDHIHGGSLVLPKIALDGDPARKPQLYAWILTAAIKVTGADPSWDPLALDVLFRAPSILAVAGLTVLTYLLGLRWFGRGPALAGTALWITSHHMSKMVYLTTTDMLLAFWIGFCVFCADRFSFHPAARRRRWAWVLAFWIGMIAAMLTKGWGIVNLAILGGWLFFAGVLGAGFRAVRRGQGAGKVGLVVWLVWRRLWAVVRASWLPLGLLAMAAVAIPLWIAMLDAGGEAFRERAYFEVVQRLTGEGAYAPHRATGPAPLHLLYNTLPGSILFVSALLLVPFRRLLGRRSPIAPALWWIITVVIAFAIPAGFRGDYLLPCYPAVALIAGWAACELSRPERWSGKVGKHPRRIAGAIPFVLAAALIVLPAAYVWHAQMPKWVTKNLDMPPEVSAVSWQLLGALPAVAAVVLALGVIAARRKHLGWSVAGTVLSMVGVLIIYGHFLTRQARSGDGQQMITFARQVRDVIGDEPFFTAEARKMGTDVYRLRLMPDLPKTPAAALDMLNDAKGPAWVVTSDRGLPLVGAYREGDTLALEGLQGRLTFDPAPEAIGEVVLRSARPIKFEKWGRLYLIRIRRPVAPLNSPVPFGYIADPEE